MDATAVAAALGLAAPRVRARDCALVAGLFGGFQALMPLLGSVLGRYGGPWLEAWNRWIAFAVLGVLGTRMLVAGLRDKGSEAEASVHSSPFGIAGLLGLAVATSLDAFFVGVTLPLLHAPLGSTVLCIGIVTALLSAAALFGARRLGAAFGPRVESLGGALLIALGLKFLLGT
jgi:manganese efflux pump family protein